MNNKLSEYFSKHPVIVAFIALVIIQSFLPDIMAIATPIFIIFVIYTFYKKSKNGIKSKLNQNALKNTNFDYKKTSSITLKKFIAFDFETTGLEPKEKDIIQIGAAKFENGVIVDQFESFVKPTLSKITKTTIDINGITSNMVKDAPTITEILPSFIEFIGDSTLIAHNAKFDVSFLLVAIELYNSKSNTQIEFDNSVLDTLSKSRKLIDDSENHKLITLKEYFSIEELTDHNAIADAIACGKLYLNLQNVYEVKKIDREIVERNEAGKRLEKEGLIDAAIELYEKNIALDFEGDLPYNRLAILYRKKKQYEDEKRVLEHAVDVFTNKVYKKRSDRITKLNKFQERLDTVNEKYLIG